MRLYTRTKRRLAANRLAGTIAGKYQKKQTTRTAGTLGNGLSMIDGQLYDTGSTNGSGAVAVVNLGRPAAAIYKPQTNGEIQIGIGKGRGGCSEGGSGTGVSDHGALTGLGDDDHPQYLLRSGARAMTGSLDLDGHDIFNVDQLNGHDVDAFFTDLAQLEADVAELQSRTVLGGTGIISDELTLGEGSPTVRVDLAGIAGDGLGASVSQLYVKTSPRTVITSDAVDVNQSAAFTWTGIHKHAANLQSNGWSVGLTGYGITPAGAADFQEITARYLYARNFVTDLELAKLGKFLLAQSPPDLAEDWTVANNTNFTVYDLPGTAPGTQAYENGDWIIFRYIVRTTGLQFGEVWGTVTYVSTDTDAGTQTYKWTHKTGPQGIPIYAGSPGVSLGQSGASYIEGNAIGSNAPRWDLIRWTTDPSNGANHDILVRLGKLDGTPSDYFTPTGDGIYAKAAWIEGNVTAAAGEVAITDDGVNVAAYSSVTGVPVQNKISLTADPLAPAANNIAAEIWAVKTEDTNYSYFRTHTGTGTNAGQGQAVFDVYSETDAYPLSRITLNAGAAYGTNIIFSAQADATTPGTFTFQGGTVNLATTHATANQILRPSTDRKADLGDNSHWFDKAYINQISTNSVLGVSVDGHHHMGDYVTPAELAAELAAYALDDHDHAEYALGSYVDAQVATRAAASAYNAHVADTSIHAAINDAGIGATDLWSAQKINSVTSTLATAAWVTGQLAPYALDADLDAHTGDTSIHFEINDAGDGADEVWSADKITTALGAYVLGATLAADYYNSATIDGLLADLAATEHTHTTIDNDLAINGALSVSGVLTAASANITAYLIAATIRGNPGITFADGDGDGLIEITNAGTLRSLAPEYASTGDGGWEIGPDLQKFTNIHAAGSISASVYEYQQVHVGMGSQLYTKGGGGKLKAEITIDSASDAAIAMDIEDPEAGHIQLFNVGDVLRLRGLGTTEPRETGSTAAAGIPGHRWIGIEAAARSALRDVWLDVVTVTDNTTHYTYEVEYRGGDTGKIRFQAGRPVANYGQDGDGGIEITADQTGAPWIRIFKIDASGAEPEIIPTVQLGRLDDLPFIETEQYGLAVGTDMRSSTTPRIVSSDAGLDLFRVGFTANDGTANTVSIDANGRVKFGTDVSAAPTTAFDFNPTADTLEISAAVTMLDESQIAGDLTLISGADFLSTNLAQDPGVYAWTMNPQGLRLDVAAGGITQGDTAADFAAASGLYTPRIEFYDGLGAILRATLRTLTETGGSYSGAGDLIATDLIVHPDASNATAVRLAIADDYGAEPDAYIGLYVGEYFSHEARILADFLAVDAPAAFARNVTVAGNFYWTPDQDLVGAAPRFNLSDILPTSAANLSTGDLWRDGDTLKIVIEGSSATNVVLNSDFAQGKDYWRFNAGSGAGSWLADAGFASISITTTASDMQLFQYGIEITSGEDYTLTFRAKSAQSRTLTVYLFDHVTISNLGINAETFALTDYWAEYTYSFTATGSSSNARLLIRPGSPAGSVQIDDVTLVI